MKKALAIIGMFVAVASSAFMFGNAASKGRPEKVYLHSNEVVCSEKGIFVKHGKDVLRAKSIAFDENGIYVLKGWIFGDNDRDNDRDPRGAHESNKRESTRDDHEKANARRQKEQAAAERRRQEAQRRGRRR